MLAIRPTTDHPVRVLNPLRDSRLLNLGLGFEGIVHLHDCYEAGLSDDKVRWLVESARWQAVYPRVFAVFTGPLPYLSRVQAALTYAGSGAALSHETAGFEYGLSAKPTSIHVTVPYEREVDRQPGVVVHRSRTLAHHHVVSVRQLVYTSVERTVVDLLSSRRSADAALGLVGEAVRARRTSANRLRVALETAPRARWRKAVLDALPDVNRGAHSPLEVREAQLRRRHGLPPGERQVRRIGDGVELLDVVVVEFGVHVELDGRLGHEATRERWRDMRRDNRSELSGLRHLRYGWADIVDRPCEVAIEQAQVLRQQGWRGAFKACPACPPALRAGL